MISLLIFCFVSGFRLSVQQLPTFIQPSTTSLGFIPGAPASAAAAQQALLPLVGAPGLTNLPGDLPKFGLPGTAGSVGAPAFTGDTGSAPRVAGSENPFAQALANQGLFPPTPAPQTGPEIVSQGLPDASQFCCIWASQDECEKNPAWMKPNCQISCGTRTASSINYTLYVSRVPEECQKVCSDSNTNCPSWAAGGECLNNFVYMKIYCQNSCRSCGTTLQSLDNLLPPPAADCLNNHPYCTYWASTLECETAPTYMKSNCCHSCKHIALIRALG